MCPGLVPHLDRGIVQEWALGLSWSKAGSPWKCLSCQITRLWVSGEREIKEKGIRLSSRMLIHVGRMRWQGIILKRHRWCVSHLRTFLKISGKSLAMSVASLMYLISAQRHVDLSILLSWAPDDGWKWLSPMLRFPSCLIVIVLYLSFYPFSPLKGCLPAWFRPPSKPCSASPFPLRVLWLFHLPWLPQSSSQTTAKDKIMANAYFWLFLIFLTTFPEL